MDGGTPVRTSPRHPFHSPFPTLPILPTPPTHFCGSPSLSPEQTIEEVVYTVRDMTVSYVSISVGEPQVQVTSSVCTFLNLSSVALFTKLSPYTSY